MRAIARRLKSPYIYASRTKSFKILTVGGSSISLLSVEGLKPKCFPQFRRRQTFSKLKKAVYDHISNIYSHMGKTCPKLPPQKLNWKTSQNFQSCYIYCLFSIIMGEYMTPEFITQLKINKDVQYTLRKVWFILIHP